MTYSSWASRVASRELLRRVPGHKTSSAVANLPPHKLFKTLTLSAPLPHPHTLHAWTSPARTADDGTVRPADTQDTRENERTTTNQTQEGIARRHNAQSSWAGTLLARALPPTPWRSLVKEPASHPRATRCTRSTHTRDLCALASEFHVQAPRHA